MTHCFPPSVTHQKIVQDGRISVGPDGWQLPDMQKKDVRIMDTIVRKVMAVSGTSLTYWGFFPLRIFQCFYEKNALKKQCKSSA